MSDSNKKEDWGDSGIHFVPYGEQKVPSGFVLRTEVSSFWRRIFPARDDSTDRGMASNELQQLSDRKLRRVVPEIDPEQYFNALNGLVDQFSVQNTGSNPLFIITKPFSKLNQVLGIWAENHDREIVPAPDPLSEEQINLASHLPNESWIITHLEDWFLRHTFGLNQIRKLIHHLNTKNTSNGVVICNSWAWNYLEKAVGLKAFTRGLYTLQPVTAELLSVHIQEYAEQSTGSEVEFRNSSNGKHVLHREPDPQNPDDKEIAFSDYINQLINYSRGNLTVATGLWSKSLRTEPDQELEAESTDDHHKGRMQTYWVLPWSQLEFPVVPADFGWAQSTVLHTLMIHDGLTHARLSQVVPHTEDELIRNLADIQERGLVDRLGDQYRVVPEAYPSVRQHLSQQGYLTDCF